METLVTKKVSLVLPSIMTKERITEKANELFMRYGVRSVSMDDIAAQLGMSKKTLYQYYTDKEELVDAVLSHFLRITGSNALMAGKKRKMRYTKFSRLLI